MSGSKTPLTDSERSATASLRDAVPSLLEGAVQTIAQPTFVLIEPAKDVDWAQWWTWWRPRRVELPSPAEEKWAGLRVWR